ncbi:hypothetical protein HDU67_009582 [Dinochytrium kinnereticum]|nr:hypothetical protein HDU67_009582 [Dinochytrium kinnereticum]
MPGDAPGEEASKGGLFAMFKAIWNIAANFGRIHPPTLIIAVCTLTFVLLSRWTESMFMSKIVCLTSRMSDRLAEFRKRWVKNRHEINGSVAETIDIPASSINIANTSSLRHSISNDRPRPPSISILASIDEACVSSLVESYSRTPNSAAPLLSARLNSLPSTARGVNPNILVEDSSNRDTPLISPSQTRVIAERPVIPDILLAVILSTTLTSALQLHERYGVRVIGEVPAGMPHPSPPWTLFFGSTGVPALATDVLFWMTLRMIPGACILGVVSYVTTVSITKTFQDSRWCSNDADVCVSTRRQAAIPERNATLKSENESDVNAQSSSVARGESSIVEINEDENHETQFGANTNELPNLSPNLPPPSSPTVNRPYQRVTEQPSNRSSSDTIGIANVSNVDLLALAIATTTGSFFYCFVPSGSLSRSALLSSQTDAKSHIASLISVCVVVAVLACFAQVLKNIPLACLALIIILAMVRVLCNISVGVRHFEQARVDVMTRKLSLDNSAAAGTASAPDVLDRILICSDALIWWTTFMSVIILDAGSGVAIGMVVVLILNGISLMKRSKP